MKIRNSLLIEKINQAIIFHNKDSKDEQISLITNGELQNEDLKKLNLLHIDISDVSIEDKDVFFEELGTVLENANLKGLYLYSYNEKEPMEVNMGFLSKLNKDIKDLQISGIDLSKVDADVFNKLENLNVLIFGNNNIKDFEMLSKLNENIAIDVGNNSMDNVSINEVINEIEKHHGRMAFNEHPFLNSIVFALEDKQIDLSNTEIPESRMEEMLQFCKNYKIDIKFEDYIKFENYKKFNNKFEIPSNIIISGTKDISTEFLQKHSEISNIKIIDEENRGWCGQEEPYSREDFLKIRQKIDEIKQQIEIPNESDKDREKKIFMQVYTVLGKMIDYNHYAVTEEGEKDDSLRITCRNLKDGLLEKKAVCAGYADILKNVLGEFDIKANYIGRPPEDMEKYAERMGYEEESEMEKILGFEKPSIEDFVKMYGYKDECGHAWNSVILDGKKYLCDLTWDADNIKLEHFPLAFCCPSLYEFNCTADGELTHDMFETMDEGEISEFSSEDQLRFLGFSDEEIDKKLNLSREDFIALLEACAVGISSEIKSSDFEGIDRVFDNIEKEEQKGYDK